MSEETKNDLLRKELHTHCVKPYTNKDKWIVAIVAGLLFMLLASPFLYSTLNKVTRLIGWTIADERGSPNLSGLILHALLFILIVRLLIR